MNCRNFRYAALSAAVIFAVSAVPTAFLPEPQAVSASAQTVSIEYVDAPAAVPANVRLDRLKINAAVARPLEQAVVTSVFGFRSNPVTGEYTFHSGVDLAAPEGTGIFSVMDGTVSTAQYADGYGNYMIIDHASGLQTLYAHCSQLLLSPGDSVSAGERIALVGSTGRSTGPHLHFEVRLGGLRYDPECVVGEMYQ